MRPLVIFALLLAGCGPDAPRTPPPLAPPSPETDGLVLEHTSGRVDGDKFVPVWRFRLELETSGRFRYAWRKEGESEWREIGGTWRPAEDDKNAWTLEPDAGEDALEPGEFVAGKRPKLKWSSGLQPAGAQAGGGFGAMWFVPVVDPETGRFGRGFSLQQDARVRAHYEKFVRERD